MRLQTVYRLRYRVNGVKTSCLTGNDGKAVGRHHPCDETGSAAIHHTASRSFVAAWRIAALSWAVFRVLMPVGKVLLHHAKDTESRLADASCWRNTRHTAPGNSIAPDTPERPSRPVDKHCRRPQIDRCAAFVGQYSTLAVPVLLSRPHGRDRPSRPVRPAWSCRAGSRFAWCLPNITTFARSTFRVCWPAAKTSPSLQRQRTSPVLCRMTT